jgi:peptidoglycan-associated lipoprotein
MKHYRITLLATGFCLLAFTACAGKPAVSTDQLPPVPATPTGTAAAEAPEGAPLAQAESEPVPQLQLEKIFFDYDSSTLTPQAREILARNAAWLRQNLATRLTIEGHCDERGSDEYNLALGNRRAAAAKKYLVEHGIEDARISIISYGEERPVDPRHNETAWAANRRDDFVVVSGLQ